MYNSSKHTFGKLKKQNIKIKQIKSSICLVTFDIHIPKQVAITKKYILNYKYLQYLKNHFGILD